MVNKKNSSNKYLMKSFIWVNAIFRDYHTLGLLPMTEQKSYKFTLGKAFE